jgi:hypothetical protein
MTTDNFCFYLQNGKSKPVKEEVNGTVILPLLVFPVHSLAIFIITEFKVFWPKTIWPNDRSPTELRSHYLVDKSLSVSACRPSVFRSKDMDLIIDAALGPYPFKT